MSTLSLSILLVILATGFSTSISAISTSISLEPILDFTSFLPPSAALPSGALLPLWLWPPPLPGIYPPLVFAAFAAFLFAKSPLASLSAFRIRKHAYPSRYRYYQESVKAAWHSSPPLYWKRLRSRSDSRDHRLDILLVRGITGLFGTPHNCTDGECTTHVRASVEIKHARKCRFKRHRSIG
jgi:hypothetical protein